MVWLAQLQPDSDYLTHLLPAMLVMSVGMAFVFIPTASVALHGAGNEDAGVASATEHQSADRRLVGHRSDEHGGCDRDVRLPGGQRGPGRGRHAGRPDARLRDSLLGRRGAAGVGGDHRGGPLSGSVRTP